MGRRGGGEGLGGGEEGGRAQRWKTWGGVRGSKGGRLI